MECNAPTMLLNVASKFRVTALLGVEPGESAAQASIKVRCSIVVVELATAKIGELDSRTGVEVQHRSPLCALRAFGIYLDAVDDSAILAICQRRDEIALHVC